MSEAIDVNAHPEQFLHILLGTTYADDVSLGYDPTISWEEKQITVNSKHYSIEEVLYVEEVIRGRGTVCYKVHPDDDPSVTYVVKDSWVDTSREEREEEILTKLAETDGVPRLIGAWLLPDPRGHQGIHPDSTVWLRENWLRRTTLDGNPARQRWEWKKKEFQNIEIREHSRLLIAPFAGRKLEDFPSLQSFVGSLLLIARSTPFHLKIRYAHLTIYSP